MSGNPDHSTYVLGYSGSKEGNSKRIGYDSLVVSTLLRWGNFDWVTYKGNPTYLTGVRWDTNELNGAGSTSTTLPASLFLAGQPGWWGTKIPAITIPWPAIGPDVTGGTLGSAGYAHKIPAQLCSENTSKLADGTLSFNASKCYVGY